MTDAPRTTRSTAARSRTSPRTISSRSPAPAANGRLAIEPEEKSSKMRTRAPRWSASRRSTTWLPMNPAPPVTTKMSVTRGIVSACICRRGAFAGLRRPTVGQQNALLQTSARERRGAEARARPAVLLARRGEDVEHDAAHAERTAAVRHVRRRLPGIARLHVVLDTVLQTDPLTLEAHAPLLVGVGVHRRDRAGLERDHRQHRVHAGKHARTHAGRELSLDATALQIVKAGHVAHRSLLRSIVREISPLASSVERLSSHDHARRVRRTASARTTTVSRCLARGDPLHYAPQSRRSSRAAWVRTRAAMPSPAFYATDFKVFNETGFRTRMAAIRARIRPKLEAVGHSLAPAVSRATAGETFAH